ncbi:MAG: pyridoxamine 5'-phosphate oxidase family protein [Spirochaetia bacterium]|jgi:nitroimidazol reductase NimA-like FMN-containing flavoprotein (pyridoxamine 5'-phosphate oxidase superfamily)|nr:pyridoxamine 5'-phosphate oxidase family protein [Spirochaetia bacterium]
MAEFREMRRKEKLMSEKEAYEIVKNTEWMTLSTVAENGYPYGIPLNHVYSDGKIYFHSALEGQKVDAFRKENRVCISIVKSSEIVPDKFSTNFKSVTAFGKISFVENQDEKRAALTSIIKKFSPGFEESGAAYIEKLFARTGVYCVEIEHITGKLSQK